MLKQPILLYPIAVLLLSACASSYSASYIGELDELVDKYNAEKKVTVTVQKQDGTTNFESDSGFKPLFLKVAKAPDTKNDELIP